MVDLCSLHSFKYEFTSRDWILVGYLTLCHLHERWTESISNTESPNLCKIWKKSKENVFIWNYVTLFPVHFSQGVYTSNQFLSKIMRPVAWKVSPPSFGIRILTVVWLPFASYRRHHKYRIITKSKRKYITLAQHAMKCLATNSYNFFSSLFWKESNSTLYTRDQQSQLKLTLMISYYHFVGCIGGCAWSSWPPFLINQL
jgi:hypothetical protein